jgi:hypothetical protein
MKARPLKLLPDGSKEFCEPSEATHVWLSLPGPFMNRFIPVQIKGTRAGTGNWTWNGDTEKPTLRPSIATWTPAIPRKGDLPPLPEIRCHTWITDGKVIFLDDCTHEFKGQTLDMLDVE